MRVAQSHTLEWFVKGIVGLDEEGADYLFAFKIGVGFFDGCVDGFDDSWSVNILAEAFVNDLFGVLKESIELEVIRLVFLRITHFFFSDPGFKVTEKVFVPFILIFCFL